MSSGSIAKSAPAPTPTCPTDSCRYPASTGGGRPALRNLPGTSPRCGFAPREAASASTNQKPALCRVAACSRPGLPSPTTRRIGCMDQVRRLALSIGRVVRQRSGRIPARGTSRNKKARRIRAAGQRAVEQALTSSCRPCRSPSSCRPCPLPSCRQPSLLPPAFLRRRPPGPRRLWSPRLRLRPPLP